ncbi:hypothetical protein FSP39_020748 [Pinctada imbricata]|uniref:ZMYM2-like/QRICH1 C-terminal domain-containing protein n=1 Tax=Pinctada imbricata TaxID=66713 RepID=A0AA89C1U9_PINIB|nr:hypothetical protein FSP39_020748 [Pinctada imbricata]
MCKCYLCDETIQGPEKIIFEEKFNHWDIVKEILGVNPVDESKMTLFICEICMTKLDGLVQTKKTMESLVKLNSQLAQTETEQKRELKDRWMRTKHVTSKAMTSHHVTLTLTGNDQEYLLENNSIRDGVNYKRGQHYDCHIVPLDFDDEIDLEMSCSAEDTELPSRMEDEEKQNWMQHDMKRCAETDSNGTIPNSMMPNVSGNLPSLFVDVKMEIDESGNIITSGPMDIQTLKHKTITPVQQAGSMDTQTLKHKFITPVQQAGPIDTQTLKHKFITPVQQAGPIDTQTLKHKFITPVQQAGPMDTQTLKHKAITPVQYLQTKENSNVRSATLTKSHLGKPQSEDGLTLPGTCHSDFSLNSIVRLRGGTNAKIIGFTLKGSKNLMTVKRLDDHAIFVVDREDLTALPLAEQRLIKDRLQQNSLTSESKVFKKATDRKTTCDVKIFQNYMAGVGEMRPMEDIPYPELSPLLISFLMNMKKSDGFDYEPATLRGFISSFDRYLRQHHYGYSISSSRELSAVRETLREKRFFFRREGRGNNPLKVDPITEEDIELLWRSGQMGIQSPHSIINTLWFHFTMYFGMNGTIDHYNLRWGDVCLEVTPNNVEYLAYRMQKDTEDSPSLENKENKEAMSKGAEIFANLLNPARCVVNVYKKYASVRPHGLDAKNAPFYLTPLLKMKPGEPWFYGFNCGHNKIATFMKKMVEGSGIQARGRKLSNSSVRKHSVKRRIDWK